jgi:hypothetical protein
MNLNTIIPGTYKFHYKKILQLHENYMSFIVSGKVPQSTLCLHTIPKALALGCDLTLNPEPYHGNTTLHMPCGVWPCKESISLFLGIFVPFCLKRSFV